MAERAAAFVRGAFAPHAHPAFADIERAQALRDVNTPVEKLRALLGAAHDELSQLYARVEKLEEENVDAKDALGDALSEKKDAELRQEVSALKAQNKKLVRAHADVVQEAKGIREALHAAAQTQAAERVKLLDEIRELKAAREEFDRGAQKAVEAATRERDEARGQLERARALAGPASVEYMRVLAELEALRVEVRELKEVEVFATAFAMLVAVNFNVRRLSMDDYLFVHAACVALGRRDLCAVDSRIPF